MGILPICGALAASPVVRVQVGVLDSQDDAGESGGHCGQFGMERGCWFLRLDMVENNAPCALELSITNRKFGPRHRGYFGIR